MPSVILECPHCGADKIGFAITHEAPVILKPKELGNSGRRFRTMMVCSHCEGAVIGLFDQRANTGHTPLHCQVDPRSAGWVLAEYFPKPAPSRIPGYATDELKRYFAQAADAAKRGSWDASGAMSRKVIDVSTQQLLGADSKSYRTIQARIDALAAKHALTPELKDWAHQVRLGGNDAAHDEDPFTQPEAEELLDFVELYLTYVYTLPGRLAERKARAAAAKGEQGQGA